MSSSEVRVSEAVTLAHATTTAVSLDSSRHPPRHSTTPSPGFRPVASGFKFMATKKKPAASAMEFGAGASETTMLTNNARARDSVL